MKIVDNRKVDTRIMEVGDFILMNDVVYVISEATSGEICLISLNSGVVYGNRTFNHVAHLRNHLNKNVGSEWTLVKNELVTFSFE